VVLGVGGIEKLETCLKRIPFEVFRALVIFIE
jgi:hypothetical protein